MVKAGLLHRHADHKKLYILHSEVAKVTKQAKTCG